MCVYLLAKFEVSRIILTSFRRRGGGRLILSAPFATSKRTPKKPTQIKVKMENFIFREMNDCCLMISF